MIHLDTHVVVWLYAGQAEAFPAPVVELLEGSALLISPMVLLELDYLFEAGRLTERGDVIVQDLEHRIDLGLCDTPFSGVIERARAQTWTRDPFDRVIVGQADAEHASLVTKDRRIRAHYPRAAWE